YFLSVPGLTIFTEATSDARWSPCDSPHHLYHSEEFHASEHLFLALEHAQEDEDKASKIERLCLRVLLRLRKAALFPPRVFLTLAEGDQSPEQRYAYGELFSTPEALEIYRTQ